MPTDTNDSRLQRAYEREWKRHPAEIELLQTRNEARTAVVEMTLAERFRSEAPSRGQR